MLTPLFVVISSIGPGSNIGLENYRMKHSRFPRLKERSKVRASKMSGGEQEMLAVARGLMSVRRRSA